MKAKKKILLLIVLAIFLLYSATCYAATVTGQIAAVSAERLQGQDRYETAVAISQEGWLAAENAVLAYGGNFPDALCAAPLALMMNAPILLTDKNVLHPKTEAELNRLGVKNVLITGGTSVVPQAIEDYLETKGYNCIRLAGDNRYETSIVIAIYMQTYAQSSGTIFVVNGLDYPDALSVSPLAAQLAAPIILTSPQGTSYDGLLQEYVQAYNPYKMAYLIGGTDQVRDSVANLFTNRERIPGADKYERNAAIIDHFADDIDFSKAYIATGEAFPDALAGSVLAALNAGPIILVSKTLSLYTEALLEAALTADTELIVLGGPGAVSEATLEAIEDTITGTAGEEIEIYFVDIYDEISLGDDYILPETVRAVTASGSSLQTEFPVTWSPEEIDISEPGEYTFEGTVEGYETKVYLYLEVVED
ncbi:MAG: cell wall-binding repeat-containing protein [Desulfitobacteriia bacterium]|jgi:putative cell wall-binding protein